MKNTAVIAGLLSLLLIATAAYANVNENKALQKMERGLVAKLAEPGEENEKVIVWIEPGKMNAAIAASFGNVKQEFSIIPAIAMDVPKSKLKSLASLGFVKKISIDHKIFALRNNAIPITASDVAMNTYGYNGTNIKIAIIDTGIYNHSEFQTPNRIVLQKCFTLGACPPNNANTSNNATDDYGHGTHVAGIAAGEGSASYGRGSAPNATIIAIKVLDSSGSGWDSDVISGMQFAVDNGANIISMSLGAYITGDCYDDSGTSLAVDNATNMGVVVVIAAGNNGTFSSSIAAPGCAKTAITVGATAKTDAIASYSSIGPTNDNRTKPDIVVTGGSGATCPGTMIISTYPTNLASSGYVCESGTSMATPLVSGIAAMLMEKYNATHGYMPVPGLVKAILLNSVNTSGMSTDGYTQRNNVYGAGRLDAYGVLNNSDNANNYSITQNAQNVHRIHVSSSSLKVTLVWMENSTTRNNLDLIVGNGTNNFTNPTDANDTVEQVFLQNINNGTWNVYVKGTSVAGTQEYFIAYPSTAIFPSFSSNNTGKNSGMQYAPNENYSFGINVNGSLSVDEVSAVIFQLNSTNYTKNSADPVYNNSAGNFWINLTDLSAGAYSYQWFANSTQNNWNATSPLIFVIAKNYSANLINLTINNTNNDVSSPYDYMLNITAWKNFTEGNLTLYRNGSIVGTSGINQPNETVSLGGGVYNYTVVLEETQNYSFVNITRMLTVTQTPTGITLLLNGSAGNYTYDIRTTANFTAIVNISGKNVTLTSNMSGWVDQNNVNITENLTILNQIGIFNITAYFAGDQNYSYSSQTLFATVVDANAPTIHANYTSLDSGIEYYPGRFYTFNVSVQDNNVVSAVILQLNSTNRTAYLYEGSMSEGNWSANVTDIAASETGYPIVWYANDTSNNWNRTDVWYYVINKNSSAYTVIAANNTTIEIPRSWSVNSTSPISAKIETRLYSNESGSMLLLNSSTGTNRYSGSAFPPNIVNISSNSSSNENYTANSTLESTVIRFVDTANPALAEGLVLPRTVETQNNITMLIVADDYSAILAVANIYNSTNSSIARFGLYYVTNTTANVSYLNRTTWLYSFNVTSMPTGNFFANVSLTDVWGNAANYSLGNFTVTNGSAGTMYSNSSIQIRNNIEVDLLSAMNVSLNISSTSNSGQDAIALATYFTNPSNQNNNAVTINKFTEISVGGLLNYTLNWVVIRINYNSSDIQSGYGENNLRIYYNHPNGTWIVYDGTLLGGVNTTEKYVWANSTHFSLYGVFVMPTCSDSIQNQGETGVDCGGPCSACASTPPANTPGSIGGSTATTTTTTTTTTIATTTTTSTTTTTTTMTATTITTQNKTADTIESEPAKKQDNDFVIVVLLSLIAIITAAVIYKNRKRLGYILYNIKKNSSLE
ncbi:MAG: S8 family serine peptidase [Candidatus Aenigmatarchaeota archaeon]